MILKDKAISIVMVTRNNFDVLNKSLGLWSTIGKAYQQGSEIVVCDHGSTDGTIELVSDFMDTVQSSGVKVVLIEADSEITPGELVNKSQDYISSDSVLFVRGNSYPRGQLLQEFGYSMGDNTVLVGRRRIVKEVFNHSTLRDDYYTNNDYLLIESSSRPWEAVKFDNIMVQRDFLDAIDWFNPTLDGFDSLMKEACLHIHAEGNATFYPVTSAEVIHVSKTRPKSDVTERDEAILDMFLKSKGVHALEKQ